MDKQREREIAGYPCPKCNSGVVKRRLFKSGPNPTYVTSCNACMHYSTYDDPTDEQKEIERFKKMINSMLNHNRFDFTLDQLKRVNKILNE